MSSPITPVEVSSLVKSESDSLFFVLERGDEEALWRNFGLGGLEKDISPLKYYK